MFQTFRPKRLFLNENAESSSDFRNSLGSRTISAPEDFHPRSADVFSRELLSARQSFRIVRIASIGIFDERERAPRHDPSVALVFSRFRRAGVSRRRRGRIRSQRRRLLFSVSPRCRRRVSRSSEKKEKPAVLFRNCNEGGKDMRVGKYSSYRPNRRFLFKSIRVLRDRSHSRKQKPKRQKTFFALKGLTGLERNAASGEGPLDTTVFS